jgi:nicotinamide riboside kinase
MEENLRQKKTDIIKIALFGPECTGKTTLAKQLAAHYETEWVPEYARTYLQQKWNDNQEVCTAEDMMPIAYGQLALENEKVSLANKYLFCDTNLLVTQAFSEIYYGFSDSRLSNAAAAHEYDLFFLTDIDVPWEKDDLRDAPDKRDVLFTAFKKILISSGKPFFVLSGSKEARFAMAKNILNDLTAAKEMGFTAKDLLQIRDHGLSLDTIKNQLTILKKGVPKINLLSPATLENGILALSENDFKEKVSLFEAAKEQVKLKKFVPASGAASRMFKFLLTFLNDFNIEKESINAYINRRKENQLSLFIIGMDKFPFFEEVYEKLKILYPDFDRLHRDYKNYYFIKLLLSPDYFDFANKPKAVLPFHRYKTHTATPIEEHLQECLHYACSNSASQLHFTVSQIHQSQFENCVANIKDKIEKESGVQIEVSYSYQNKSTDSITVDMSNNPLRGFCGELVFRPGGHGALIQNLNNLDSDIVFIKNIDNVIQNHVENIAFYKKALAGILIELQTQIFRYLKDIDDNKIAAATLEEIVVFLKERLLIELNYDFYKFTFENKIHKIKELLDRPIRVCGMVKNEGEPGGGPFWVMDHKGVVSLQIVESSQIDMYNKRQVDIVAESTFFNPVDLVCGIKNYKNEKFDLTQFVDHNTGFIVEKSNAGQKVKSYELPGLWNGAMAKWLTIFVAVPISTFNPVKTVNDLLKTAHQPE